jgi:hypothetical protein
MAPICGIFGSGTFGYYPTANAGEPDRSVSEAVFAPVVLRQQGVAALIGADPAFAKFAGRADSAAESVSFECVSHTMASSVSVLGIGSTSFESHLFPICGRYGSRAMRL